MAKGSKATKATVAAVVETAANAEIRSSVEAEAIAVTEASPETAAAAPSGEAVFIPLDKLKKSPRNARKPSTCCPPIRGMCRAARPSA